MIKTRADAIAYLRTVAKSEELLTEYQKALYMAIEALEQVEKLERSLFYAEAERDALIKQMVDLEELVMKQGEMNLRLIGKELEADGQV